MILLRILLALSLTISQLIVAAQSAVSEQIRSSNTTPLIGEPFTLTLTISAPADAIIDPIQLSQQWEIFNILNTSHRITTSAGNMAVYEQAWTALLWNTGEYQTPPMTIEYQLANASEKGSIVVEPTLVMVASILNPEDLNLRPMKAPLYMPYISPLWLVTVIMALGTGGFAIWHIVRRRHTTRNADLRIETPLAEALRELHQIDINKITPAKACSFITQTLKNYIQRQHRLAAEEMTTEELLNALHEKQTFNAIQERELGNLLHEADLIKFARTNPQPHELNQLLDAARKWLKNTLPGNEAA